MLDSLRSLIRRILQPPLWLFYRWYLSRSRWYHYDGLKIRVHPSVFHPGLLFSSKILYEFAIELPLQGKQVLELGAGAGLVAMGAARKGAEVTASDINPAALRSMEESCKANQLRIQLFLSDLFDDLPPTIFDFIFINPPYYPKDPANDREQAFFCGSDFRYFRRLFDQLPKYIGPSSMVYLILTDDCDLKTITGLVREAGFRLEKIKEAKRWGEWNFIYALHSA